MKKCIILANGNSPKKSLFPFLNKHGFEVLIAADGGANNARKLNLIPDYIIGDLDSITKENLDYFSDKTIIKKFKRQDDTDVEKCLKFAIKNKFTECALLGVIGDRLDHSFGNLGIAKRFSEFISIIIVTEMSILTVHTGNTIFDTHPGEIISIYGFDDKTKITSKGLKYPIDNEPISFGKREGTSNQATGKIVELKIKNGRVFVIRELKTIMRYHKELMEQLEI